MGDDWSPLATKNPVPGIRFQRIKPWGLAVHTTGDGVVEKAQKEGKEPFDVALAYYKTGFITHYVVNYDGKITQLMPDNYKGAHIGIKKEERLKFLSGAWEKDFEGTPVLELWKKRWPDFKSPQHLYPTKSPNTCYLGCEMVPLGTPRDNGLWFTDDQHQAIIDLWNDRAAFHEWEGKRGQLIGHEDVAAYSRWQKSGGWDPGALRLEPRFDWDHIRAGITTPQVLALPVST